MTNQTVKNMELVLLEIRKEVFNKNGDSKAVKTLIHSYQTMISSLMYLDIEEQKQINLDNQKHNLGLLISYIENNLISDLLYKKEYIQVNNYSVILEKMSKCVESIGGSNSNKKKFSKVNSIIDELLNLSVKSGTLVLLKDEVHRGMGKTTALVKKAHELGCVLVCANPHHTHYARTIRDALGLNTIIISARDSSLAQYSLNMKEAGYIVDEGIKDEILSTFNKNNYKLLGGFISKKF